jgi:hypothetical protein
MDAATRTLMMGCGTLLSSMASPPVTLRKHSPLLIQSIGIDEVLGKINDISILVEAIIVPIERALKELFIGAILELPIDHLDVAKKFILKATISFRLMQ